jgi:transcriptional regulator with XRE-family HTH domain
MVDDAPEAEGEETRSGIGEFIRSQRRLAKLSLRQLSDVAKVSNAYLSQIERGIYKPSAKVLKALGEALHVSAETLYARAGFLEEDPDVDVSPAVENAIRMDPRLTTEQKETLLRVYRGFAGSDA